MKKGQRPSTHVRNVMTKRGRKKVVVNPNVRKRSKPKKKPKFYKQEEGRAATPWSYDVDKLPIPRGGPMIDPRIPILPDEEGAQTFDAMIAEQIRINQARRKEEAAFEQQELDEINRAEKRLAEQVRKAEMELRAAQALEAAAEKERLKQQRQAKLQARDKIRFADAVVNKIMKAESQKEKYALYKKKWGKDGETIDDVIRNAELLAFNSGRQDYVQKLKELKRDVESQIEPTKLKIEKAQATREFNIRQGQRLKDYLTGKMTKTDAKFFELTLPAKDLDVIKIARDQMRDKDSVAELMVDKGLLDKSEAKKMLKKVESGDMSPQEFQAAIMRAAITPADFKAKKKAGAERVRAIEEAQTKALIEDTAVRELKDYNVTKPRAEQKRKEVEQRIIGGPEAIRQQIAEKKDALAYLRAEVKGTKEAARKVKERLKGPQEPEEPKPFERRPKDR